MNIDPKTHDDGILLAKDLLAHLEDNGYPEHECELVEGIVGELEGYKIEDTGEKEDKNYDEMSDEDLEEEHFKSLKDKEKKPAIVIAIGTKKSK